MDNDLDKLNDVDSLAHFISEKQKELQDAITHREIVEDERYILSGEILEFQRMIQDKRIKKIELDRTINKSKAICMTLALDIRRATQKFWSIRNC